MHRLTPWPRALVIAVVLIAGRTAAAAQPVHEVQIIATRFQFEPAVIQVTPGEPVRLVIRSTDGTHGFSIPKLKIDALIAKSGDPVTVEFVAPAAGQYEIACSEFCGRGHGQMKAALVSAAAATR
jgi:cytochrome c oxidase subunit 2